MHGQFAWYELSTSDPAAAKKFYATFTGWAVQPFDETYSMFTSAGVPVAGVFPLPDELRAQSVPPYWMPYVEADDVAESARLATSLGGSIVYGPTNIPNVGDIAVVRDPQGAVIGLYKPSSPGQSWDGTPVIGQFSWNELMTSDHKKAWDFYSRVFRWEIVDDMDMGGGMMYRLFGKGGAMYGGMYTTPKEAAGMPSFWLSYIHVRDVPAAVATATKGGATVHRQPMDIPGGGVIAILGDPQGAGFALHQQAAASGDVSASKPGTAERKSAAKSKAGTAKQAAAKKAAPEKAAPKKAAAKKVVPKKAAAGKAAPKKAAPKKAAPKKAAPKKAAPRKAARKSAAKKKGAARSPAKKKSAGARKKVAKRSARAGRAAAARKRTPAKRGTRKASKKK